MCESLLEGGHPRHDGGHVICPTPQPNKEIKMIDADSPANCPKRKKRGLITDEELARSWPFGRVDPKRCEWYHREKQAKRTAKKDLLTFVSEVGEAPF